MRQIIVQNLIITIVAKFFAFISFLYIARILAKDDYGIFVYISMIMSLLPIFQFGSMHGTLVLLPKYFAKKEKESEAFFQTFNFSSHALQLLAIFSLFFFEKSFGLDLLLVISIHLLFYKYSENVLIYLNALHEFNKANAIKLIDQVIRPVIVIILFHLYRDVQSIFLGHMITSVIVFSIACYFKKPSIAMFEKHNSRSYLNKIHRVGFLVYLVWVIDLLFRSSDKWFISQFYPVQDLASYGFVSALALNVWLVALSFLAPYSQVLYTYVAKSDFISVRILVEDVNKKLYVLVFVISAIAIISYPFALNLVIHKYFDTYLIFFILVLGSTLLSINNMYIYYMISNDFNHILIKYQISILLIHILINLYISYNQLDVIYLACSTTVTLGVYLFLVRRYYKNDILIKTMGYA